MDLNQLKGEINKIMEDNKPTIALNSKIDKKIREYEYELAQAGVESPFFIKLSDIDPEISTTPFANGKFSREEYALSWSKDPSGKFRLILTNLPHKNSKILLKTPENFKEDAVKLLDKFIVKFSEKIKS